MKIERAKEIMESKGVVEVDYHGTPVWITNLNWDENIAEVELLDQDRKTQRVDVAGLNES